VSADVARSLLLVEDDEILRRRLARAFEGRGYEVREAPSGEEAVRLARADTPEVAVVDLRMAGMSGLDVVSELRELDASTVIVVLTGYGSIATALEAVHRGAVHYLTKPADVTDIVAAFGRAERDDAKGAPDASPAMDAIEIPTLARVEWEHINRVLNDCGGNVSQAARLLGIHRRSLQRKLSKYPSSR
jgi:two-component system response regulator RegA